MSKIEEKKTKAPEVTTKDVKKPASIEALQSKVTHLHEVNDNLKGEAKKLEVEKGKAFIDNRKKNRLFLTVSEEALIKKAYINLIDNTIAALKITGIEIPYLYDSSIKRVLDYYLALKRVIIVTKNSERNRVENSIYTSLRKELGIDSYTFKNVVTQIESMNFITTHNSATLGSR